MKWTTYTNKHNRVIKKCLLIISFFFLHLKLESIHFLLQFSVNYEKVKSVWGFNQESVYTYLTEGVVTWLNARTSAGTLNIFITVYYWSYNILIVIDRTVTTHLLRLIEQSQLTYYDWLNSHNPFFTIDRTVIEQLLIDRTVTTNYLRFREQSQQSYCDWSNSDNQLFTIDQIVTINLLLLTGQSEHTYCDWPNSDN